MKIHFRDMTDNLRVTVEHGTPPPPPSPLYSAIRFKASLRLTVVYKVAVHFILYTTPDFGRSDSGKFPIQCCLGYFKIFSLRPQALRNEQERTLADMRERHEQDTHKMDDKLEREVVTEEAQAVELLEAEKERRLRELKDRHAAELAARSKDMSSEEVQQVFIAHDLFSISCKV